MRTVQPLIPFLLSIHLSTASHQLYIVILNALRAEAIGVCAPCLCASRKETALRDPRDLTY
jgi:hypothetical protein